MERLINRIINKMFDDQKYWNPILETLPQEKLRDLQFKKFKRIFEWAYDHSKFHRSLYEKAGIMPHDIRSFGDIRRVLKVEKAMMRGVQNLHNISFKLSLLTFDMGYGANRLRQPNPSRQRRDYEGRVVTTKAESDTLILGISNFISLRLIKFISPL